MRPSGRLRTFLGPVEGRGRADGRELAFQLVLVASFVLVHAAAFGLFVPQFGARSLPYVYLALALVSAVVVPSQRGLAAVLSPKRLVTANLAFLGLGTLLLWLGVATAATEWVVFALPVWLSVFGVLVEAARRPLVGPASDESERPLAVGLLGPRYWAAYVLGGIAVPPLVLWLGPAQLLLVAAAGVAAAAALSGMMLREAAAVAAPQRARRQDAAEPARWGRLAGLIVASLAAASIASYVVDLVFYLQAAARYPDAVQMTVFIGSFMALTGLAGMLVSAVLASRVHRRFGPSGGMLVVPVLVALAAVGLVLVAALGVPGWALLWFAAAGKLVIVAFGFSLSRSAAAAVGRAVPESERGRLRAAAEGAVQPLAIAAAGAALLVLVTFGGLDTAGVAWILVAVSVAWIAISRGVAGAYLETLSRSIAKRRWGQDAMTSIDPNGVALLREHLRSPHTGAVIYALERLGEHEADLPGDDVVALLRHRVPEIRGAVLRLLETNPLGAAHSALSERLAAETVPQLRAATLRALAACGGRAARRALTTALDDADPVVRAGAVIALLRHGTDEGLGAARATLERLVASPRAADRASAAQALGTAGIEGAHVPLLTLLDDPDPDVRRAAVQAAGAVRHPQLWPEVIRAGDTPGTARPVERALAAGGDGALDAVEAALADQDLPIPMVVMLVRACGRMTGERAIGLLLGRLDVSVSLVRWNVLQALAACSYRASDTAAVQAEVVACTERLRWIDETLSTLTAAPPAPLLRGALDAAWRREQDLILLLLTQIGDAEGILMARPDILRGEGARRAQALDVLGGRLTAEWRDLVLPWLEASPDPSRAAARTIGGMRPFLATRLEALVAGPEARWFGPWPAACALHAIGALGLPAAASVIEAAEDATDPLISGTARWTRRQLAGHDTGRGGMLSSLERVLILKTVQIFAGTPDAVLADVADVLDEVEVEAGATIIRRGDPGDSMYIVVDGKVGVHDGDRTLDTLGEREAFGEMALLDPEPRVASVTALETTRLLRLPQAPFHELLHDRPEIAIAIMRVLAQRLRDRIRDLAAVSASGSGGAET